MSLGKDLSYSLKWDPSTFNNFIELDANKVIRRGLLAYGHWSIKKIVPSW